MEMYVCLQNQSYIYIYINRYNNYDYFNVNFSHLQFERTCVFVQVNLTSWLSELQSEMHPFSNNIHATIAWITTAKR